MEELRSRMTIAEYRRWRAFYKQFPFDDRHRYYRPAALVRSGLGGVNLEQCMDFLEPSDSLDLGSATGNYSEADLATLKALGKKPPRMEK